MSTITIPPTVMNTLMSNPFAAVTNAVMTPTLNSDGLEFEYRLLPINGIQVKTELNVKTGKNDVTYLVIDGDQFLPTERFWVSLFARYGFNKSIFKYFDHAEVFERIAKVDKNDNMRICIERFDIGTGIRASLLAVSNPGKPVAQYDDMIDLLDRYGGNERSYSNGIIESIHTPARGSNEYEIDGDKYANRFLLATPIDGYGSPSIYLGAVRLTCSISSLNGRTSYPCMNSIVAQSTTFKGQLQLGKAADDVTPTLVRALDSYNNEEGFGALHQRLGASVDSWASVRDVHVLYKLLVKLHSEQLVFDKGGVSPNCVYIRSLLKSPEVIGVFSGESEEVLGSPLMQAFHVMTGDVQRLYGLANMDALSEKRQRSLPVKCRVYELINFISEIATHQADVDGARELQTTLGGLLQTEYDLEGTRIKYQNFQDFYVGTKLEAGLSGSVFSG